MDDENAVYPITIDPLSTSPDWTAEGDQTNSNFGYSVASAGDVNNDGFSDVIIGAPYYTNGELLEGRVFVYYGSASGLPDSANWTKESNSIRAQYGNSVSTAGDVNNDNYDDVIIGAHVYDNDSLNAAGRVYVYYGSDSGLSETADWTVIGDQANARLGRSVSTAGDVNGDNYSDVIVGAMDYDEGENDEGKVFVFYGSSTGLSITADWTAQSNQQDAEIGCSVASAGDINNDGYSDIIAGARYYTDSLSEEGAAFVWYGSIAGLGADGTPVNADWSAFGGQDGAGAGETVSSAGDVNGDGFSDVIVGIPYYDNGQDNEGIVNVYLGSDSGLSKSVNWSAESDQQGASFGYGISCAGDVNNDGFSDLLVGAPYFNNGEQNEGKAYLYLGSLSGLSDSADWTAESDQMDAVFGRSVSSAGDVNDDGFSDVIIGAHRFDNKGKVFVYYGFGPSALQLDLAMFIQGFYNSSSDIMVGDTVTVYLRNSTSPYAIVDSAKTFVNSAGQGTFTFSNAADSTPYYIELVHRNSIETWSKTAQQFTASALSYDFTTANTQAYGDNMADIDASPVRYGIYSGDENQNGLVDLSDVVNVSNDASSFTSGYVPSDMNGDNFTDLSDLVITSNNASAFVAKIIP
ncbi:MAG: integrin alpha [Ignavibacteria bacterium]